MVSVFLKVNKNPNHIWILTPKGLGLPYVGFSDSRQVDVNSFYFWNF
jgi:hypothetical protein